MIEERREMPNPDPAKIASQRHARVRNIVATEGLKRHDREVVAAVLIDIEVEEGEDAVVPLSKQGSLQMAVELIESHKALEAPF